jgi:hypothetical protein
VFAHGGGWIPLAGADKTKKMNIPMKKTFAVVAAVLAVLASTLNVPASVRYVDLNCSSPVPPFSNWTTAATSIQDAIDVAAVGDVIWVTNGVYANGGKVMAGDLTNRVALNKAVTVCSVNGPQETVIQGQWDAVSTNGPGAVRCAWLTNGAVLRGFTLRGGATRSTGDGHSPLGSGGGVWCASTNAVVANCTIKANAAWLDGGGAYSGTLNNCALTGNSASFGGAGGGSFDATLNNCTLTGNSASSIGGGSYGGTLNNCTLAGNSTLEGGGGSAYGTLNNCTLTGNSTSSIGGGSAYGTLNNCTLTGNSCGGIGGGSAYGTLNNCTLTGNTAGSGGGGGGGAYGGTLNNCTLTGNSASPGAGASGATLNNCIAYYNLGQNHLASSLNYCCTTPLPDSGTGNFANTPLLDANLRLPMNSPCVNAGNNTYVVGATDLAGRPRIIGGTVDVGAYEFQGPYLNVAATAGGSVIRDPDQPDYPPGSLVTVTAIAATGYGFIRWTGDASGNTNPLPVTMSTNKSITAVFASTALTLTIQGVGTVAKAPDQPYYSVGEPVTLSATAGRWHVFSAWLDGPASNPRTVTIGESNAYTAVFMPTTPLETVTIGGVSRLAPVGMPAVVVDGVFIVTPQASARGSALVTLSTTFPGGSLLYTLGGADPAVSGTLYAGPFTVGKAGLLRTIAYTSDFTQSVAGDPVSITILPTLTALTYGGGSVAIEPPAGDYFSNSLAVVTATSTPGWTFLQWLGDAAGTNPVVNLSMTRSKTVRAVFGTALSTATVGGGSVVVSPLSPLYPYGSLVRLTPVPATGNYHALWANAAAGRTNNPLLFAVTNANRTVTAVFASLSGTLTNALTVIPDGRGEVDLSPPGNRYRTNSSVVLQATPELGQAFLGWSGAASGSENPLTVTLNSNKVITASFTKRPWLQGEGGADLLRQEGFRLTLTGEFGTAYQFLGSPDLGTWLPLATVTNTWGTVQFTDPAARTNGQQFYRAQAVE